MKKGHPNLSDDLFVYREERSKRLCPIGFFESN